MAERLKLEEILCGLPELSGKKVWIWGAGNTAKLYYEGFHRLEKEGFSFEGYIDSAVSKKNKIFNGKPVKGPEVLQEQNDICVLICTIQPDVVKEIKEQCSLLGAECRLVDEVILKSHRKEVLECYDMLYDERSREVYAELVKWRITGNKPEADIKEGNQYFCLDSFQRKNPDEVFVDCGAYTGDTIEEYLKQKDGEFGKIIAFEPDKDNFSCLKKTVEKECSRQNIQESRFELYPYGIGEHSGAAKFEHYGENDGLGSKIVGLSSEEEGDLRIVALDEFLTEPYSFLKADIESYEYQMLLGAENGIRKYRPLLAVCIYHNAVDFYSIPLLIKRILPEYKLAVRHHLNDLSETVVYAWIQKS